MKALTLITGGIRSGKSRYALELADARSKNLKGFVATAEALDDEMTLRIARHRAERGSSFSTVEEPLYLARAVRKAQDETELILIDCLTVWVNNLLYRFSSDSKLVREAIRAFAGVMAEKRTDAILITNETGLGVVPDNPTSRRFTEELGNLNQQIARMSDEVIFMVSGIPVNVKMMEEYARLDRSF